MERRVEVAPLQESAVWLRQTYVLPQLLTLVPVECLGM